MSSLTGSHALPSNSWYSLAPFSQAVSLSEALLSVSLPLQLGLLLSLSPISFSVSLSLSLSPARSLSVSLTSLSVSISLPSPLSLPSISLCVSLFHISVSLPPHLPSSIHSKSALLAWRMTPPSLCLWAQGCVRHRGEGRVCGPVQQQGQLRRAGALVQRPAGRYHRSDRGGGALGTGESIF